MKRKINNLINNENNTQNYSIPINYPPYPILFNSFPSNNFQYSPLSQNLLPNYNNNSYINFSINNNSLENTQESCSTSYLSTSEDKIYNNYYDNFGENYYDSLKRGIKDISNIYNKNKTNRPKVSLICNYYCNLERTPDEESYINNEIQRLSENLKNILLKNNKEKNCKSEIETNSDTNNIKNSMDEENKK